MGDLEKIHEKVAANLMKDLDRFRKEAEYDKEKNLYYAYFNVDYNYSSILCTVISKESPDAIYVFAMDHFHRKEAITVSLRNQSGRVDMNAFARKLVEGLEASSAGGHLRAAGAGFLKKDLAKFKERLLS